MGLIIRQGIKGTIANYLGIGVGVINTLFLFPKFLTEEEIGLVRIMLDVSLIFASFAQLGFTSTMIKFYPNFKDNTPNKNGFFFFSFLITLIGFFFFSIIFYFRKNAFIDLYAKESPLFQIYFDWVYPLTFVFLFITVFETISSLFERITVPKIIREIYLRFATGSAVVLYYLKFLTQEQLIISIVLIYFLALILNILNTWIITKFSLSPRSKILKKKLIRQIGNYTLYLVSGSLGMVLVAKIDTLMLGATKGLNDTGIYSIAFFIAMFVETPKRSIDAISTPIISSNLKSGNLEHIKELNHKSSLNLFIASGYLFLMIYLNTNNLFSIMPNGSSFIIGKNVILFVGLAKVFEALSGLNSSIIGFSHLYKHSVFITLLYSILGILLNYLLIPEYGINGAAFATLVTIVSVHTYMHFYVFLKLKITSLSRNSLLILAVLILIYFFNFLLPVISNPILDILFRSSILSILFFGIIIYTNVSVEITNLVKLFIEKLKNSNK